MKPVNSLLEEHIEMIKKLPKFKVGDVFTRVYTGIKYKVLEINRLEYVIELPSGEHHYISIDVVDKQCRKLTKLEKVL